MVCLEHSPRLYRWLQPAHSQALTKQMMHSSKCELLAVKYVRRKACQQRAHKRATMRRPRTWRQCRPRWRPWRRACSALGTRCSCSRRRACCCARPRHTRCRTSPPCLPPSTRTSPPTCALPTLSACDALHLVVCTNCWHTDCQLCFCSNPVVITWGLAHIQRICTLDKLVHGRL